MLAVDLPVDRDSRMQTLGEDFGERGLIAGRRDEGKFVAAKPGQVSFPAQRAQLLRQLAQQIVADGMTKGVVDFLEAVEIDAQHGEGLPALRRGVDGAREMLDERGAIGQVRQGIMMCHMFDTGLGLLALGDILRKAQQVALLAGFVGNRKIPRGQDPRAVVRRKHPLLGDGLQLSCPQGSLGQRKQGVRGLVVGPLMRAEADQVAARDPENGLRGPVDQHIAAIPGILDGDGHRHVLDDIVEEPLGAAELGRRRIEGFELAEMNQGNRQARESQRQEAVGFRG